ncbi:Methyltransferase domain-containing protein [Sporobacter termitidis DSM 10068]|uniref:Methyltransferase domain-containing protein n=1 Tax=Sporobacter termitidis DSM 10068 TaxID=1123282 RepID=A0A1M5WJJ0_9FIRM|nr:class I SAM-dependent methyltransferase [Sporobacter termitidis]SHH87587.1 Methyltransferase domain-containing protein [Sporobacter termitidis DSM 10068]
MSRKEKLLKNWTESSANYSSSIINELNCFKRQAWLDLILTNAGSDKRMKVLDVGTGPGFFAILMSLAGHDVTAIDCTQAMINEARSNAEKFGAAVDFRVSDTQELDFPDESFDLIINRNVVWTIIDAEKAYREWRRVLRTGGKLLVFDANWNIRLFSEEKLREYNRDREEFQRLYPDTPLPYYSDEMEDFRKSMPMCARIRPQWDFDALIRVGFKRIGCNTDIRELIYDEKEQLLNRSTPMFLLAAEK